MPWAVSDEAGMGRTRLGGVSGSTEIAEISPLWCRDASCIQHNGSRPTSTSMITVTLNVQAVSKAEAM